MPTIKLTELGVKQLKSSGRQVDYHDATPIIDGVPGRLCLRVSQNGRKAWCINYRINGKKRRYTLDKGYPAMGLKGARTKAAEKLLAILAGEDPAEAKQARKRTLTFKELADLYLERHAKKKKAVKSYYEDKRYIESKDLKPWRDRKARDIKRKDVIRLLDTVADRAPVGANRLKALISKIYNFGIQRDEVELNPTYQVAMPTKETARDRTYTDEETKDLWAAFKTARAGLKGVFELILLTAQRPGEVAGMRRSELQGDRWLLPPERTKNRRPHVVPLSRQAQRFIEAAAGKAAFVFPAIRNNTCTRINSADLRNIRKESGVADFTAHDLRRTALTNLGKLGVSRFIQDRIANHADASMGGVYDRHEYFDDKMRALDRWADRLDQVLKNKKAKVIKLRGAK